MFISSEFDNFLKEETEREKIEECKKRKNECYGCLYEESCAYEELLNDLEEW